MFNHCLFDAKKDSVGSFTFVWVEGIGHYYINWKSGYCSNSLNVIGQYAFKVEDEV